MIKLKTTANCKNMSIAELKKHCLMFFDKYLANKDVKNTDTGATIILSKKGAKHALFARPAGFEKIICLTIIDKIVAAAKLTDTEISKSKDILCVMKFSADVVVDAKKLEIIVFVRVSNKGKFYYDHVAII